jgi:hypothetical protein
MANTIGTTTWNQKYFSTLLAKALRRQLVAEAICKVDRSDDKYIYNPYGSTPTTTVQSIGGTYTVSTFTTTNDTLTVDMEFNVSEHIYAHEMILSHYDLYADRMEAMKNSIATAIDSYVLNMLCEAGTGTYSTPSGGFTTAANVNKIFANLTAKVTGYNETYNGMFIVLENSDMAGITEAGATNGYETSDSTINNGKVGRWMGVDIYVTRDSTFTDGGKGGNNWTNDGHRVFGIKGVAMYAAPRGILFEEKLVSTYSGKELFGYGLVGFKLWYNLTDLIIDVTVSA